MDILVLSDSHGAVAPMVRAVELARPDLILHLGDCWRDGERLRDRFPDIPLEQVPGNCDFLSDAPAEQLLVLGGKRILMCHGHTYRVKTSLLLAGFAAEEQQLDLFLFGLSLIHSSGRGRSRGRPPPSSPGPSGWRSSSGSRR